MIPVFKVRGASIDGTVWYQGYGSWGSDRNEALELTLAHAERVVEGRKNRNKLVDADECIGRLAVVMSRLVGE